MPTGSVEPVGSFDKKLHIIMSRIQTTFSQLAEQKRKALITFITAGDPAPELTVPLLHALVAGGVDILELGVPFSDPMADGPVIQRAGERALAKGISLRDVLAYVREFRASNDRTPIVLMGYYNPIFCYGVERFIADAKAAGVDGLRADLVWLRAARAHAAWRGAGAIEPVDIDAVEDFVLRHRRRQQAPQPPAATPPERPQAQQSEQPPQQGEGQWGELPAQVQAMGERRVPPRWTKKP